MYELDAIYGRRWTARDDLALGRVWAVLVRDFFQQFISEGDTVLDLGAGRCHFINNVAARRRIAFDGNPDVRRLAAPGVEVIVSTDLSLPGLADAELDCVFVSNFLEHLPSGAEALRVLRAVYARLKPDGRVIVLQPNFRYAGAAYFDFIDHQLVLTDRSLAEALEVTGFHIEKLVRRFLPYTSKSSLPKHPALVALYLRLPLLWRIFGQQTLAVARKPAE